MVMKSIRIYKESFANRQVPSQQTFANIEKGSFKAKNADRGRQRGTRTAKQEEHFLDRIEVKKI